MDHSLFRSMRFCGLFSLLLVSLRHVFHELVLLGDLFASVLLGIGRHRAKLANDRQPVLQYRVGNGKGRRAGHDHGARGEDRQVHARIRFQAESQTGDQVGHVQRRPCDLGVPVQGREVELHVEVAGDHEVGALDADGVHGDAQLLAEEVHRHPGDYAIRRVAAHACHVEFHARGVFFAGQDA